MGLTSDKFNNLELQLQLEKLVIGLEEPLLIKDIGKLTAKVDSGNGGYNVIHGEDIITQGDTILFKTIDDDGNMKNVSKKVVDTLDVNIGGGHIQSRPVIELDVQFADKTYKKIKFSVTDRSDNTHKILISKDFIENTIDALIDVGAKNISDQNIEVDVSVNEASDEEKRYNDFKKFQDYQSAQKSKRDKEQEAKYKGFGGKLRKGSDWFGGVLKKYDNALEFLKSHGGNYKRTIKIDNRVEVWRTPAELFAAYPDFYKKDIANIRKQLLSSNTILNEFIKGDTSNTIISKDGKKIDANSSLPISLFSYILKKGDAGPNGKNGVVINGQEQRRKLWYQFNGDAKKAMKETEKEVAKEESKEIKDKIKKAPSDETDVENKEKTFKSDVEKEKTEELINASFVEIINGSEEVLFEGAVDKSYDATFDSSETGKITDEFEYKEGVVGGKAKQDNTSSENNIDAMQSEAEKIRSLKAFIVYYVPFYKGKDSKANISEFDKVITSGKFDPKFSGYINAGNGSNASSCASVVSDIKKYFSSNETLLEKHPGLFALCWSQDLKKDAPRFVQILPAETFIRRKSIEESNEERNAEIRRKLIEKYELPVVDDDTDFTEINQQLIAAIKEYSGEEMKEEQERIQKEKDFIEALIEKLGLIIPNKDNIDEISSYAKNAIQEFDGEINKSENIEKAKKQEIYNKLSEKLGLINAVDKDDIDYHVAKVLNLLNEKPEVIDNSLSDEQIKNVLEKKLNIQSYDNIDYQVLKIAQLLDEMEKNKKEADEKTKEFDKKNKEISDTLIKKLNLVDISNDESEYELRRSVEKLLGNHYAHISPENLKMIKKLRSKFNLINAPKKKEVNPKVVRSAYDAISDYLGFKLDPKVLGKHNGQKSKSHEGVFAEKSSKEGVSAKTKIKKSSPSKSSKTITKSKQASKV